MTAPVVSQDTLRSLEDALLNRSGDVPLHNRFRALFTLKALKNEDAVKVISAGFADDSALLKHELAYCLGQMKLTSALPTLESVLRNQNEDPMVRHEAAEAMGAISSSSSLPILKEFLQDSNRSVRETCEIALAKIEWDNSPEGQKHATILQATEDTPTYTSIDPAPATSGLLSGAPKPELVTAEQISSLQKELTNTELPLFQRYRAMFALRNIGTAEAVDALASGFTDDSALFKHEIAFIFGQMLSPHSVPSLLQVLQNTSESDMVRHEAAEALGGIATPEVLPHLKEWMQREDAPRVVRESCQVAIDMWEYENSGEFQYANGLAATAEVVSPPPMNNNFALKEASDRFSPKDLVLLERPSAAVPNPAGDLAFVTVSKYSLEDKKNHKTLVVLPLESNFASAEIPLPNGGEFFWLTGTTLAHVVEGKNDNLDIYAYDCKGSYSATTASEKEPLKISTTEGTLIGSIPSKTATNFIYNPTSRHLVFSDNVYEDANLTSIKEQDKAWENRGNSAYVYDDTYIRHWDTWVTPKKTQLFSVRLHLNPDRVWKMGEEFHAPLKGTGHHSPVEPFGGTEDFDVSASSIVYTSMDPQLPPAWHTKQNVYIVDIMGRTKPRELTSGKQGATHSPVFSKQGDKVAWLELDIDGDESARAKVVIYDLEKDVRFTLTQHWDRSPEQLAFNQEGTFIYFTAGDRAKSKIYYLPVPPTPSHSTTDPQLDRIYTEPVELTSTGSASSIQPLHPGRLLFTRSSLTSPNDVFLIQHLPRSLAEYTESQKHRGDIQQVSRFTESTLAPKGLDPGEEFYFTGADDKQVHGWAFKPRGWEEGQKKKYPVVFLIHGGPQSAWMDSWSTRWNPNVFTGQGYFVLAFNPTGSTTFGQKFTDAIKEDGEGKPFIDMVNGWKYALEKYPEIDPDRAVAAGASWGGYAINWIQGHPEYGFGFKALVCHDGEFDSTYTGYSTDELFFFNDQWGGRPWEKKSKKLSSEYSPSNYVHKWSTPELVIHSSKDYRLPETEGIAAFHALQQLGVPSRLVIFPDENHWVLKHGNSLKWHYEVFRWFDQFVGDHLYLKN
ncbi:hypothetical protein NP233_g1571 [Leucocoprinus birnbaumii]|uniref:Deoxyhypusine hydroxylase n=1 Tax=Leucocoprinus birnbaumii TaxID=56174 RepID=A0AAD5W1X3_9AGAR|nr:hypothetical protein NP233_g1571 [Leucocoprinus birnbaumii]